MLSVDINNSYIGRLKAIVDKFSKNGRIWTFKKNFLSSLMGSHAGKIAQAFNNIRNLPPKSNNDTGVHFFSGLIKFINNRVKTTFEEFKKDNLHAILEKRNAALLMIRNSMSAGKKAV